MDCHDKSTTVDLCSEPECLDSVVTFDSRSDLAPHTPNHNVLKVHRIFFNRDTARTERNAKDALETARQTLSDLEAEKEPMPQCVQCENVVSLPCWYCADCTSEFTLSPFYNPLAHTNLVRREIHLCRLRV